MANIQYPLNPYTSLIIRIICKNILGIYLLGLFVDFSNSFIVCVPFSDASRYFLILRILNETSEVLGMNKIYYFTNSYDKTGDATCDI